MFLGSLLGSVSKEMVLTFIAARGNGYAREIAKTFDASQTAIKHALDSLEFAGVIIGQPVGKTRVYQWNRRYPAYEQLQALVQQAVSLYPDEVRERLQLDRRRPRRRGKPL